MKEQNVKNHTQYVPGWHGFTMILIIALLVASMVNIFQDASNHWYSGSLFLVIAIIFVFLFWYARAFALKAQDRAIRAEENLRHFIMCGKPLPSRLRLRQIIALRFASDEEFLELAQRASDEMLSPRQIKLAIKQWKPDFNRV